MSEHVEALLDYLLGRDSRHEDRARLTVALGLTDNDALEANPELYVPADMSARNITLAVEARERGEDVLALVDRGALEVTADLAALERLRPEYERLRPSIPYAIGEREWPDRVRSWSDFLIFGALVAETLRDENPWEPGQLERLRTMAPELADFVLRAFPESPAPAGRRQSGDGDA